MIKSRWLYLAILTSACGSTAVDTTQSDQISVLEQKTDALEQQLAAATEALTTATAALSNLEAHERLVAAEVIDDGLGADGVSDDLAGLSEQLATSRIDALEGGASASCTDICVTDAELALTLVDYATDADIAPLATRVEVEAGDAAEQQWVIDQHYLTDADLSGYATTGWVHDQGFATVFYVDTQDALLRQWVEDQDYATHADLDPYATDADLAALAGRLSVIEADYVQAADLLPFATDADLAALEGRVSMIEGDYLQAADLAPYATQAWVVANYPEQAEFDAAVAILDDHEARIEALEAVNLPARLAAVESAISDFQLDLGGYARVISADTTIRVPTDAPDIQAALNGLQDAVIDAGATVTIEVEPAGCGATYTAPIVARHRDGAQVHIVSQSGDPVLCVLTFVGTTAGVVVDEGYVLGELSGFSIVADGAAEGGFGAGVEVNAASALLRASPLVLSSWPGSGLSVDNLSYAAADGIEAHDNGGAGLRAVFGSVAHLVGASAHDNGASGIRAVYGSFVDGTDATAADNAERGFMADEGSTMTAVRGHAVSNDFEGIYAGAGAWVHAPDAISEENGAAGVAAEDFGGVYFVGGESRGNGLDGVYAVAGSLVDASHAVSEDNGGSGYHAWVGSTVGAGLSSAVANHNFGYLADRGSTLNAASATASANLNSGFVASGASNMEAGSAVATGNDGHGFDATHGSQLSARDAHATDLGLHQGFVAQYGSSLDAHSAYAEGGFAAFEALEHSYVDATHAWSHLAARYGFVSQTGSFLNAGGAEATHYDDFAFVVSDFSGLYANETTGGSDNSTTMALVEQMSWFTASGTIIPGTMTPPQGSEGTDNSYNANN